jgi:hypothetical protein
MVRLVSSGTEAAMSAIRLARGATGRSTIIKFEGCYHGHADALLVKAGSGLATFGHPTSAGVPQEVVQHTLVLEYNNVAQLEEAFAKHGADLACVIIEPIAGNMNFVRASLPFMQKCRELCTQHGALLVFDEVMTGFRVALGGAQGVYAKALPGFAPDITVLGKVIGGGMPLAAFGGPRAIMEKLAPLGPVYQAGTLVRATRWPRPAGWRRCRRLRSRVLRGAGEEDRFAGGWLERRGAPRRGFLLPPTAKAGCSASSSCRSCRRTMRGDEERCAEVRQAVPRPAGSRRVHRAGVVRGRVRDRRRTAMPISRRRSPWRGRCSRRSEVRAVIPAEAGTQSVKKAARGPLCFWTLWIPAFAGMTGGSSASMPEVPHPREHHRHAALVGRINHFLVAHAAPGWITQVAPASTTTSSPSRNGKNASLATAVPASDSRRAAP